MKQRRCKSRYFSVRELERLELRELLAGDLISHWRADDLLASLSDGDAVPSWIDSVGDVPANAVGMPQLKANAFGGRAAVLLDQTEGLDYFRVEHIQSPMKDAGDFTLVIAFATSLETVGDSGPWFENTGLVDANNLGLTRDWGVTINQGGQVSAGLGSGFGQPTRTVYSTSDGLNDGQLHFAYLTRAAGHIQLYVDEHPPDALADADTRPRFAELDIAIGALESGSNALAGEIAEIRIYDGALSSDELATLQSQLSEYYQNQAPTAVADEYQTVEDTQFLVVLADEGVLANDSDHENDVLHAQLVEGAAHGSLALRADGSFIYTPDRDFFGDDHFTYTANDHQSSEVQSVTIHVEGTHDPVTPHADSYKLLPTQLLSVDDAEGVLSNDSNPDNATLTVRLDEDVSWGQLSLAADGSFSFDPQGRAGTTTFSYHVDDGVVVSEPATVSLTANTPPVAVFDDFATAEDLVLIRDSVTGLLANDSDTDGDAVFVEIVSSPNVGEISIEPTGAFRYLPPPNFSGRDSFSYRLNDGHDVSQSVLVSIDVWPVNDAPVAIADSYFTLVERPLDVQLDRGVLSNDTDVDSTRLTARLVQDVTHGQLLLSEDGSFQYQPNQGFAGLDQFSYRVSDGEAHSEPITVTLTVSSIVDLRNVVINEIHYDPDEAGQPLEFIELYNRGPFPIEISDWKFTDGIDFTFPRGSWIDAGGYLVVSQDPTRFGEKFQATALGPWNGRLSNDGETIELRSTDRVLIDEVDYRLGYPWPTVGATPGHSIQLVNLMSENDVGGNWRSHSPSPGMANAVSLENVPPLTRQVNHEPISPVSGQEVKVTMKVTDTDGLQSVFLDYQTVDPGSYIRRTDADYDTSWTTLAMNDLGRDGDAVPNDSIFTVVLPASLQTHRRLVRYRITATDRLGAAVTVPYADDPQPNFAYFVYDGVPAWLGANRPGVTDPVTYGADVMNSLPAYHLIAQERDIERSQYSQSSNARRFLGTLVYDGVVYDHIAFRNRGQFSTYVSGKNKWKLIFNRGHEFQARDDYGRPWGTPARKLNFGTAASPWARPNRGLAGMDEALAFKFFNLAGVAAPNISAFQLRVIDDADEDRPDSQYEGDLWGLYLAFEDPGGRFLSEHDLPEGNLFRMAAGATEIKHQGLDLPGNLSDVRAFTSGRSGYNKRRPIQPLEWWRENVELDRYYSYRAVIEAINHSDLRDQQNSLLYFNAETQKWSLLPWDLDLLYEEFDRWGPDGVQDRSRLEQFRLALDHEEINLEFQARLREMQDLFFNNDQAWQAVEEYARYVEPFAAVDRAMWDYHPRTSSIHRGFFYRSPAPYHGGAAGLVRRELTSPDFEGMINWVKQFIVDGGFGGSQLKLLHQDPAIPTTPAISYVGPESFPIDDLRFQTSAFSDPQGDDTFQAIEWRIGEVTDPAAPAYDPNQPVYYEINPVWDSGTMEEFASTISLDASALRVGHAYRARVRMQDQTGRWSHWSDPVQFITTAGASTIAKSLRVSEVNYHPLDPSSAEDAAGYDADDFEYIELVNIGEDPIQLAGAQLLRIDNGEEGVAFDFAEGAISELPPGAHVLVVEDIGAFEFRYGQGLPVAGQWSGRLNNSSETITLAAFGEPFLQFQYADRWHPTTDGNGSSLEIIDAALADLEAWSRAESWRPSVRTGGTPGTAPTAPGDANRDRVFDSTDLVAVFRAGEYEDEIEDNSTWEEGDWDGDGDFTSSDLVLAFRSGQYVAAAGPLLPVFAHLDSPLFHDHKRNPSR